jgi:hypothetical protein
MNQRPIIQTATDADIPDVLSFVLQARAELFPKLGATGMPADLAQFEAIYLLGDGRFLIARVEGQIVAAIGYLPYDARFPQLNYHDRKTVEVVDVEADPVWQTTHMQRHL